MTKTLIDKMVDRFLGWKLPQDFSPDAGISFARTFGQYVDGAFVKDAPRKMQDWPIGTNLLTADQARAMIEHLLDGALQPMSEYDILRMHKALPIRDVDGIGDARFKNIVRLTENSHGIKGQPALKGEAK